MADNWLVPLSIGACALFAVAILWKLPQWQVRRVQDLAPKEHFDRVNEARKTLATILGGLAFLVGGFFTWQNLKVAQENLKVSQEGQITDRFSKAIQQLGAVDAKSGQKELEVRLGGIYALERIADESERDYWPIIEVLCTYVRVNAPAPNEGEHGLSEQQKPKEAAQNGQASASDIHPAADIQAILTVLSRRKRRYERPDDQVLDLSHTDLRGADLSELHLEKADLSGANLTNASLIKVRGSETNLSKARLYQADLSWAYLKTAVGLIPGQVIEAKGNDQTTLPPNLSLPNSWKK